MKLNRPKNITFYISVILIVLGLLGKLGVSILAGYSFWLVFAGAVLLVLGILLKDM